MSAIFDLTYLKEVSKGNNDFMLEMINIFLSKTPETLKLLENYIEEKNWEQVGFFAHKLKATYAYMGMLDLKEDLIKIEKSAKNMDGIEQIPEIYTKLKSSTAPALTEIEKIKNTLV